MKKISIFLLICFFLLGISQYVFAQKENFLSHELFFLKEDLQFKQEQGYDTVSFSDTSIIRKPGEPQLPVKVVHFAVDPDKSYDVKVLVDEVEVLEGLYHILPAQESARYNSKRKFKEPDQKIYGSNDKYPKKVVVVKNKGRLIDVDVVTLFVYPLQYSPEAGTLFLHKHIKFELIEKASRRKSRKAAGFKRSMRKGKSLKSGKRVKNFLKKVVVNGQALDQYAIDDSAQEILPEAAPAVMSTSSGEVVDSVIGSTDIIDYLIVTNQVLKGSGAFDPLIENKQARGISVGILTMEEVNNSAIVQGRDLAEKIRNVLKELEVNNGLTWVLLGGDTNIVPARVVGQICWESEGMDQNCEMAISDMYYSDLDGDWDADGDGSFGEYEDGVDLYPDVFVGRAPVENVTEARTFVNKVLTYKNNIAEYYDKALFFGCEDFEDAGGRGKDHIDAEYMPDEFQVDKYYERDLGTYREQGIDAINNGYHLINHIDHADFNLMHLGGDEFTSSEILINDVDQFQNANRLSILWSCGCWPAAIDHDAIAEHWVTNPNGGAVAFVGNTRYGLNPESDHMLDPGFYKSLFEKDITTIGETLADSKIDFIPYANDSSTGMRYAMMELLLLGDPEMEIVLNPGTKIKSPSDKDIVSGPVEIIGDAYGEQFDHYELLYAAKVTPETRYSIAFSAIAVQNDVLGSLDTTIPSMGE